MFSEVIPQAVCTSYGLVIGSTAAPFVRVLMFIFFPISYPISALLDKLLPDSDSGFYRRAEIKAIIETHRLPTSEVSNEYKNGITNVTQDVEANLTDGPADVLTSYEVEIIERALEMHEKRVVQVMTDISKVRAYYFMLCSNHVHILNPW